MSLHSDIVKILNDEGAASEGGWHSWRCFDKDRYPEPCECTEVVASMVISAALDAAREAVVALKPRLKVEKYKGGYDCCGCSTTYDLMKDALAAIDALKEKP